MYEASQGGKLLFPDRVDTSICSTMPKVLDILLLDRTTSTPSKAHNIIWANDHYQEIDPDLYAPTAEITKDLVTGELSNIILPRALKAQSLQKKRTKANAEVFTPIWIVKKQNDVADIDYANDDLETYVNRKWLEITCGEAPYMATRYDVENGELVPLADRVGFVDRKLARINKEIADKAEWQRYAELAYKASYGFEWNGDSLLLARKNLLNTYEDYYQAKWNSTPTHGLLINIATIISFNIFQMDGLTYIIPLSETRVENKKTQLSLFDFGETEEIEWVTIPGKRVRIMNWDSNKMEYFDKGLRRK
ncbi:hypothetical protein MASR2M29_17720 [Spirochaetota bacterium]